MTAVSTALFASVVTCMVTVTSGTYYPAVNYVDGNCGATIKVSSDARIKLTPSVIFNGMRSCSITLVPKHGSAVVAKFLSYSINSKYANDYGNCPQESIQLYDSQGQDLLVYLDYCSTRKPAGQFNLLSQGTFGFTVATSQLIYPAYVDLLVTEVVSKLLTGSCPSGYFDCQTGNCVADDVQCNGYDDCGNNRDETVGCALAVGVIVGIALGVTIFVIILVVLSLLFRRHRRRRVAYVQYN